LSLLGIDIGTTGCKAVAFNEKGKMLSSHYRDYQLYTPDEGRCEIDPNEVLASVQEVITNTAKDVERPDPVKAVGISTLGDSVTPIDENENPIYRTVIGVADRRAVDQVDWIEKEIGRHNSKGNVV